MPKMTYNLERCVGDDEEPTVTPIVVEYEYVPRFRGNFYEPPHGAYAEFVVRTDVELTPEEDEAVGMACVRHYERENAR